MSNNFIIIDGNSVIHRAYHAIPRLTNKEGESVNAIYGFFLAFFRAMDDFRPSYVAVCFDTAKPTFRHEEYKEYKAKRPPAPKDLVSQLQLIRPVLKGVGAAVFEKPGFEADDLIATVVKKAREDVLGSGLDIYVLTGDLDSLQLVNGNTKMYILNKGVKNSLIFDSKKIGERLGVVPSQVVALKALAGDASDNIPGIKGIGKKIALELLKQYQDIDDIFDAIERDPQAPRLGTAGRSKKIRELLINNKEKVFFFKKMVTMRDDVPIDFSLAGCAFSGYGGEKTEAMLKELGFTSLLKRLPHKTNPRVQTLF